MTTRDVGGGEGVGLVFGPREHVARAGEGGGGARGGAGVVRGLGGVALEDGVEDGGAWGGVGWAGTGGAGCEGRS